MYVLQGLILLGSESSRRLSLTSLENLRAKADRWRPKRWLREKVVSGSSRVGQSCLEVNVLPICRAGKLEGVGLYRRPSRVSGIHELEPQKRRSVRLRVLSHEIATLGSIEQL